MLVFCWLLFVYVDRFVGLVALRFWDVWGFWLCSGWLGLVLWALCPSYDLVVFRCLFCYG